MQKKKKCRLKLIEAIKNWFEEKEEVKEKRTIEHRTIIRTVALHYTVLLADRMRREWRGCWLTIGPGIWDQIWGARAKGSRRWDGFGVKYWHGCSVELRVDEKEEARRRVLVVIWNNECRKVKREPISIKWHW